MNINNTFTHTFTNSFTTSFTNSYNYTISSTSTNTYTNKPYREIEICKGFTKNHCQKRFNYDF